MKKLILPVLLAAGALATNTVAAEAAAKQYVVVIAEGTSPQVLELGKGYLRKSDEDPELVTAFDSLMEMGKAAPVGANAIAEMNGLLETAEQNGFQTGFITTTDVTKVAPLFYSNVASAMAKGDFIGGGGRTSAATAGAALKAAGGTYIADADGLAEEIKGRVLALQADGDLSYAIDRMPETESGLAELATLAMDVLGENDTPYVLVVHDTLVKKALDTKDTPALFEQFRELNSILGDALARQEDNAQMGVAALLTGGEVVPQFQTGADANGAFFTISSLRKSFTAVGTALKGESVENITIFVDPIEGEYRGWKLSDAQKSQIAAGTLNAETVARSAYEPVLRLDFARTNAAPVAYTSGIAASAGLVPALKAAVSSPAK